ncbi:Transcriptional regulator, LysR family (fragment) [Mesorhizobium metallidurans STM 2683]|uniref:Transcriptional regulator, LysR family n=1 Tax=Mesorhizobium metallidurans STM 2683 TaxID=1297569 RepID=M5EJP3_9HYPH
MLASYTLLHDAHDFWRQFIDAAFPPGTRKPTRHIRFSQTSLAIEAAIAGQGLALASQFFVASDIASGKLVRAAATQLRVDADFYLLRPRKPRNPATVSEVRNWLAEVSGEK